MSFAYDVAGRMTNRLSYPQSTPWVEPGFSAVYDDDNRMISVAGNHLNYDLVGNLLASPLPDGPWGAGGASAGATGSFTWNARNQLTQVTRSDNGGQQVTYTYDAEGHRIQTQDSVAGITRWIIDPHGASLSRVLAKVGPNGEVTRYIYGGSLLYELRQDSSVRHYHYDHLGNTVALTNQAGEVTTRWQYSPYGMVMHKEGTQDVSFLYGGAYGVVTDKETGLVHMRARYYHPHLCRFLSEDPIGFDGGMNWYAYVEGMPLVANDPNGEFLNFVLGAAANVVIGGAIRAATGGSFFDAKAMATDAAIGVATSGFGALAQLRNAHKLAQAGKIIAKMDDTGRIAGQASSHTFGHNTRMIYEAAHHAQKGAIVYLDKSLGRALGQKATTSVTRMKPDVTAVYGGGRVHVTEIVSKTQSYDELAIKVRKMMRAAPGVTGNTIGTLPGIGTRWVNPFMTTTGLGTSVGVGGTANAARNQSH
jgi:RHS repeat-associated protein